MAGLGSREERPVLGKKRGRGDRGLDGGVSTEGGREQEDRAASPAAIALPRLPARQPRRPAAAVGAVALQPVPERQGHKVGAKVLRWAVRIELMQCCCSVQCLPKALTPKKP
jgi:hypothetical protein